MLTACDSGSLGSNVGNDNDISPTAELAIIGATSDGTEVRSGSEVILTAKNSVAGSNPVVGWRFNISGPGTEDIQLIEESSNSRSFEVPHVAGNPQWEVGVTIFDSDGNESSDSATLNVISVADAGQFLAYRGAAELIDIVAALAPGQQTPSTADNSFTIEISSVLVYPNRNAIENPVESGLYAPNDEIVINRMSVTGAWPDGVTTNDTDPGTYQPLTAYFNPRFRINIPLVDIDTVNSRFEQDNRERQLDPWKVDSAFIELRTSAVGGKPLEPGNPVQLLFVSPASTTSLHSISPGETILVEDLHRTLPSTESEASAAAYYDLIDGGNDNRRLSNWLDRTGFLDADGNLSESAADAHAVYLNNYDLGFGRDMYIRTDEFGNVFSFVKNYPTLENAIDTRNELLTVAMEYSPPADDLLSSPDKFVKFFAFVPDQTGDSIRVSKVNFDGRGERFLPGACTVCHGGQPKAAGDYDPMEPLSADINASFMPWDLDSFLYSAAADANLVDPEFIVPDGSVSESIPAARIEQFSRDNQEVAFQALNKAALSTYKDYVAQARIKELGQSDRFTSSIDLVNGWYSGTSPCGDSETFCGDYVPAGWQTSTMPIQGVTPDPEGTYVNVFARNCRACHVQLQKDAGDANARDFDTYDEFVSNPSTTDYVFDEGYMPFARLTLDRFWVDFHSGPASGSLLQAELGLPATDFPGSPESLINESEFNSNPPQESPLVRGEEVIVELDVAAHLVKTVAWRALAYDVGSEAMACDNVNGGASFQSSSELVTTAIDQGTGGAISSHAAFVADKPGNFTLAAEVTSKQGISTDVSVGTYNVPNNCPKASSPIASQSIQLGGDDIPVNLRSVGVDPGFPGDVDVAPMITIVDSVNVSATVDAEGVATISCQAGCATEMSAVRFRITDDDGDFADGTLPIEVTAAAVPNGPSFDATSPPVDDLIVRTSFNSSVSLNIDVLAQTSGGIGTRTISVTSPGNVTQHSGTLSTIGGTVLYTPPPGFIGVDSFTYHVTDSNPATPQTSSPDGVVTITVDGVIRFDEDINTAIFSASGKNCVNCHEGGDVDATDAFDMRVFDEIVDHLTGTNNLITYPPSLDHTGRANASDWDTASNVFSRWAEEGACDIDTTTRQPEPGTVCPNN